LSGFFKRLFGMGGGGQEADGPAAWESRAAEYLVAKGLRVLARNVRTRRGEIDIIAADGETIVFVEVKARRSREFGGPEYAIDAKKRRRLVSAAKEFAVREKLGARACRFDAVLIYTGRSAPEFQHITNAFGETFR